MYGRRRTTPKMKERPGTLQFVGITDLFLFCKRHPTDQKEKPKKKRPKMNDNKKEKKQKTKVKPNRETSVAREQKKVKKKTPPSGTPILKV